MGEESIAMMSLVAVADYSFGALIGTGLAVLEREARCEVPARPHARDQTSVEKQPCSLVLRGWPWYMTVRFTPP